jgi:hypothetical protein
MMAYNPGGFLASYLFLDNFKKQAAAAAQSGRKPKGNIVAWSGLVGAVNLLNNAMIVLSSLNTTSI